jgi:hypothetical protein
VLLCQRGMTSKATRHGVAFVASKGTVKQCLQVHIYTMQCNSIQFNSIQFNSIQFNSIQFNAIKSYPMRVGRAESYKQILLVLSPGYFQFFRLALTVLIHLKHNNQVKLKYSKEEKWKLYLMELKN